MTIPTHPGRARPAPTLTRGFAALLAAGFVLLGFLLLGPVLTIPLHIPINYNEGWNAVFDARAVTAGAGPLYPAADSFVFNNYPPAGFYVVGALGRFVFGDMILAGRVTALLALLAAAALAGDCVRSLGASRAAALAAGLLLLLTVAGFYRTYVAMDDPQWLAQATMLGGLAVLLRGWSGAECGTGRIPLRHVAAAALLMAAGGFVKHNLIALPLAVTVWLAWVDRRAAATWVGTAMVAVAAGLAATYALHGPAALADVLHHRRVFRAKLMTHAFSRLAPLATLALAETVLLRRAWLAAVPRTRAAILFVALFGVLATVTGILQRLGEGVYYNAHFETLVAVCIGFGLALAGVFEAPLRWRRLAAGPVAVACFAALPLIGAWPWHLPIAWHDVADRHAREASWRPVIARIAAADGPAGCVLMSLCWWAGKPSQIDLFNLTESVARGGPFDGFRATVQGRRIAVFEDDPTSFTHKDFVRQMGHDPIMEAFAASGYAPVLRGPDHSVLLAPARAPSTRLSALRGPSPRDPAGSSRTGR